MEVVKAPGGSFKLATPAPKSVREMTHLPKETQKNGDTNKSKTTNKHAKHKSRLNMHTQKYTRLNRAVFLLSVPRKIFRFKFCIGIVKEYAKFVAEDLPSYRRGDFALTLIPATGVKIPPSPFLPLYLQNGKRYGDALLKAVLNVFFSLHHLNCLYLMNTKWYLL